MFTVLLHSVRSLANEPENEQARNLFEAMTERLRAIERIKREIILSQMQLNLEATKPDSLAHRYFLHTARGVEENLREVVEASPDEVIDFWWMQRLGAKSPDRCINSIRETTITMGIAPVIELAELCIRDLGSLDPQRLLWLNRGLVMAQAKRLVSHLEDEEFDQANRLLWDHDDSWALCSGVFRPFRPSRRWSYNGYGEKPSLVTA